jgi:hypothetical protein
MSYATSYTISYTISYTLYLYLLSSVLSGGLFHWKKGLAYSVVNESLQLYHDVPENTLLNDVFFYVMYHLSSFQNMHEYQLTKETEIFEYVHKSTPAIPGSCVPETHRISKQLVAYLETLVAFSPLFQKPTGFQSSWWPTWRLLLPLVRFTWRLTPAPKGMLRTSTARTSIDTRTSRTRSSTSTLQGRWKRSTNATVSSKPKADKEEPEE